MFILFPHSLRKHGAAEPQPLRHQRLDFILTDRKKQENLTIREFSGLKETIPQSGNLRVCVYDGQTHLCSVLCLPTHPYVHMCTYGLTLCVNMEWEVAMVTIWKINLLNGFTNISFLSI
jgi:hypothetical protein